MKNVNTSRSNYHCIKSHVVTNSKSESMNIEIKQLILVSNKLNIVRF